MQALNPQPVRFAAGAARTRPGGMTDIVDKGFGWAGKTRTREMLVEDFMGFGILRTGIDLMRGYIFGTGEASIPVARERLFREGSSIFTDNIVSGLAAWGLGKGADRKLKAYSNGWTDFPTMELFRDIADQKNVDEKQFIVGLTEKIAAANSGANSDNSKAAIKATLEKVWRNPAMADVERDKLASELALALKRESLDLKIGGQPFRLDNLLDDVRLFSRHMQKRMAQETGGQWQAVARKTLDATLRVKNWKLAMLGVGMILTFLVPKFNTWMTRKIDGIDSYTGEIGLKRQQAPTVPSPSLSTPLIFNGNRIFQGFAAQSRPTTQPDGQASQSQFYVARSLKEGKKLPLLLTLLPLPFAAGLFDTVNLKFLKPWKPGFGKTLRNLFDFAKRAPFTTQQQMAATFALLITSRLLFARSDNEFRERFIDSGLGWVLWILGTPALKKLAARILDKKQGTMLLKEVDGRQLLRTREEIQHILPSLKGASQKVVLATEKNYVWIGAISTITSMILLGIVEPLLGILWTKRNEEQKTSNSASLSGQPVAPNRFQTIPAGQDSQYRIQDTAARL